MENRLLEILRLLSRTPSADNSQPWRFAIGERSLRCHSLATETSNGPFGPLGHATLLSAGAMHESMKQLFGDEARIEVRLDADRWAIESTYGTLPDPLSSEAAQRLAKRHTNRFPYNRQPIVWPQLPIEWPAGGRAVLIDDPRSISTIAAAVKICSAVRFTCQELHEWLYSSLRWNEAEAARGDGIDIASLHLPPGGRLFMRFLAPWQRMEFLNRFGLYKIMAAAEACLVADAPGIVAIVGERGPTGIWEAGRLMQATWVALNASGLAVHPYYVVTDIANRFSAGKLNAVWRARISKQMGKLNSLLGLSSDEQIHMLLRVGFAQRTAKPSARLPLECLID